MGKYSHLMIHCTDTPEGREVTKDDLIQWHIHERGWSRLGYSGLWHLDGHFEVLIPYNNDDIIESWEISNGARGWNGRTRHFCYAGGGRGVDTRTALQIASMRNIILRQISMTPEIKVIGHNQVSTKYCPSFDVPEWCKLVGIPERNIDFNTYH